MARHKAAGWQEKVDRITRESKEAHIKQFGDSIALTTEAEETGDLRLSPIRFLDPRQLKDSPYNGIFEELKDPGYWEELRRDIAEAGSITDPLLILEDGEIVSGHSRRKIALELLAQGRQEFDKVPVRVLLSPLSENEKKKRVYLGNLSRFEIDPNTRLMLYTEIYPGYFANAKPGRPKKGDTVSPFSRGQIADSLGISTRQLKREKHIHQEASKKSQDRGEERPTVEDIKAAREEKNTDRRKDPITPKEKIKAARAQAQEVFLNNGQQPYDAGVVEGLNRALELLG